MFKTLGEAELKIVIDAMEECKVQQDQQVIKEGDKGDLLYVVEDGKLDCFKLIEGEQKKIKEYEPGEAFGELALLYTILFTLSLSSKRILVLQLSRPGDDSFLPTYFFPCLNLQWFWACDSNYTIL